MSAAYWFPLQPAVFEPVGAETRFPPTQGRTQNPISPNNYRRSSSKSPRIIGICRGFTPDHPASAKAGC